MRILPLQTDTLPLSNNGELSIFFLGTGSAFSKKYNQTNFLVVKGDTHLLVDCGATASKKLHGLKRSLVDIKNYHITHSHADHIGGLEEAMLSHRYGTKPGSPKPNLIITESYRDFLWDYSLKGGNAFSEVHNGEPLHFTDFWEPIYMKPNKNFDRETWECQFHNLNLKMPRTCHFPSNVPSWRESTWSTGLIIDERVFLTSDTRYDPELLFEYENTFDIEAVFHDCQFFTGGIHASLEELSQLPKDIKSKMVLNHYGDNMTDHIDQARDFGFHSFAMSDVFYTF